MTYFKGNNCHLLEGPFLKFFDTKTKKKERIAKK